ncbi:hypothetical protein Ciccas_008695 [Cichlidogyrus casuarinus]|uniref:Transcription initiation factor TFIID subunit 13 n=1 Tax=Cichlidogyrus casuarinus TaxID=1844966 RepID=A0ABD2Q0J8_9PLAT
MQLIGSLDDDDDQDTGQGFDRKKKLFSKESKTILRSVRALLNAFGDDENPVPETVSLIEEMAVKYIMDTTMKASQIGRKGKVGVDELLYLVRNDKKKFSRVKELLLLHEELRKARKVFEESDY